MKFHRLTFSGIIPTILLLMMMTSCYHDADLSVEPSRPGQDPDLMCSADTVYFQNTIFPLINSGCATTGCHDASTQKAGETLDSYSEIIKLVKPFDPQNSKLYTMLFSNSDGRMPPDSPFSTDQKSLIYWWIKQGAYNNVCNNILCDSTNVTYTESISPLISKWCISCHGESNPSSGLSLGNYSQVVASAKDGRLMGALKHEPSYSPMPKNGQLSACGINMFQIWINTGTPQ